MPKLTQAEKYLAKRILLEEADRTEENGRKWAEAAEAGVRTAEERTKFREVAAYQYKTAEKIRGIVGKIESEKKNKPSEVRSKLGREKENARMEPSYVHFPPSFFTRTRCTARPRILCAVIQPIFYTGYDPAWLYRRRQ